MVGKWSVKTGYITTYAVILSLQRGKRVNLNLIQASRSIPIYRKYKREEHVNSHYRVVISKIQTVRNTIC